MSLYRWYWYMISAAQPYNPLCMVCISEYSINTQHLYTRSCRYLPIWCSRTWGAGYSPFQCSYLTRIAQSNHGSNPVYNPPNYLNKCYILVWTLKGPRWSLWAIAELSLSTWEVSTQKVSTQKVSAQEVSAWKMGHAMPGGICSSLIHQRE